MSVSHWSRVHLPGVLAQTINPITWEAQPGLQRPFPEGGEGHQLLQFLLVMQMISSLSLSELLIK